MWVLLEKAAEFFERLFGPTSLNPNISQKNGVWTGAGRTSRHGEPGRKVTRVVQRKRNLISSAVACQSATKIFTVRTKKVSEGGQKDSILFKTKIKVSEKTCFQRQSFVFMRENMAFWRYGGVSGKRTDHPSDYKARGCLFRKRRPFGRSSFYWGMSNSQIPFLHYALGGKTEFRMVPGHQATHTRALFIFFCLRFSSFLRSIDRSTTVNIYPIHHTNKQTDT